MNLPEWCRKYIKYVEYDPNLTFQNDKYEVTMKALPDDPYADKRGDSVYFYADTLTELKRDLEYYRTDYARFNYEYWFGGCRWRQYMRQNFLEQVLERIR